MKRLLIYLSFLLFLHQVFCLQVIPTKILDDDDYFNDTFITRTLSQRPADSLPGLDRIGIAFDQVAFQELRVPDDNGQLNYIPIVRYNFDDNFYWTNPNYPGLSYRVPREVAVTTVPSTYMGQSTRLYRSFSEFKQEITVKVQKKSWFGLSKKSTTTKKVIEKMKSSFDAVAVCEQFHSLYYISLWPSTRAHPRVLRAVNNLPNYYDKDAYVNFIRTYGTHYTNGALMGGRLAMDMQISQDYFSKKSMEEIINLATSNFIIVSMNKGSKTSKESIDQQWNKFVNITKYVEGGDIIKDYDAYHFSDWVKTIKNNPSVIDYTVGDIADLISDPVKKANIERAIDDYLRTDGTAIGDPNNPASSCRQIYQNSAHPQLIPTGSTYYINPNKPFEPRGAFKVRCDMRSGGWTIIDIGLSPAWQNFFTSFQLMASLGVGMPSAASLPSKNSWKSWFMLDRPLMEYRISEDCQTCKPTPVGSSETYYITGNYYGCGYFNSKCDMAGNQCSSCFDGVGLRQTSGRCSHVVREPTYSWPFDCVYQGGNSGTEQYRDYWNMAPSVGLTGQFCVCYRSKV
jgi:hypothetical protein